MTEYFLKGFLPLLVLGLGVAAGAWFFMNPEEAQKKQKPDAQPVLVKTDEATFGTWPAAVEAMGQVIPALEIALKAQVAGEILAVSDEFIPGGFFREGDVIANIDPADYALAVKRQEAILRQTQADYDLEMGRQSIAKDELKILERTTGRKAENPALALRRPQLEKAQAEREKAQADLEAAQLNLSRTWIAAPFNALVKARNAGPGDKISAGEPLATLVNTDEYWVEIAVPVTGLQWLSFPRERGAPGSLATINLDGGRGKRTGSLLKLAGTLDTESRMATLLVRVPDPLLLAGNAEGPPLILGDYVRVILEGKPLEDMARVPLSWIRDGGTVWIEKDGKLVFRTVRIAYEDREYAYIAKGLARGEKIVVSDIAVPAGNMAIRGLKGSAAPEEKTDEP